MLADRDFGPFEILSQLGSGGMGTVYLAVQKSLGRKVVLKVLHQHLAGDENQKKRFEREAKAAAALRHENVVQVIDCGFNGDLPYIALELVPGVDLRKWMDLNTPVPVGIALLMLRDIAQGLAHAHRQGVVHRDIKPANVMVGEDGVLKIMDFGLARSGEDSVALTQAGGLLGTPAYMSPEQAQDARVDLRSDIFSAGIVGFEMLSGSRPFPGDSYTTVLQGILYLEPPPLGAVNRQVPEAAVQLIHRMLEKDPARRPQELGEVVVELDALLDRMEIRRGRDILLDYVKDPASAGPRMQAHVARWLEAHPGDGPVVTEWTQPVQENLSISGTVWERIPRPAGAPDVTRAATQATPPPPRPASSQNRTAPNLSAAPASAAPPETPPRRGNRKGATLAAAAAALVAAFVTTTVLTQRSKPPEPERPGVGAGSAAGPDSARVSRAGFSGAGKAAAREIASTTAAAPSTAVATQPPSAAGSRTDPAAATPGAANGPAAADKPPGTAVPAPASLVPAGSQATRAMNDKPSGDKPAPEKSPADPAKLAADNSSAGSSVPSGGAPARHAAETSAPPEPAEPAHRAAAPAIREAIPADAALVRVHVVMTRGPASVYVDGTALGKPLQRSATLSISLKAGRHTLRVQREDEVKERSILVQAGDSTRVDFVLSTER